MLRHVQVVFARFIWFQSIAYRVPSSHHFIPLFSFFFFFFFFFLNTFILSYYPIQFNAHILPASSFLILLHFVYLLAGQTLQIESPAFLRVLLLIRVIASFLNSGIILLHYLTCSHLYGLNSMEPQDGISIRHMRRMSFFYH